jgi:hypothetical protein
MLWLLQIFLLVISVSFAKAKTSKNEFQSRSVGHLLTSNNQVLQKNHWGLGTMFAGYGITDRWTVATSPFVLFDFNMFNLQSRAVWQLNKKSRFGIDLGYYKSINPKKSEYYDYCLANSPTTPVDQCTEGIERIVGFKKFKMEAWAFKGTYSQLLTAKYRFSTSLSYFYYTDDERPFSFRMDPANNDKYSLALTTLHEMKVARRGYLNVEVGFWGLNYQHPYYHAGLTYNHQTENWVFAIGASSTFNPDFPRQKIRKFVYYDSRWSLHPEIQIQRFF